MKKKMFALAFGLLLAFGVQGQWISPEELPIEGGGDCGCPTGCIGRPGENNGVCRKSTARDTVTYMCVDSSWFERNDCVK